METYQFFIILIVLFIECIDIGIFFAKLELYQKIRYMDSDKRTEISEDLYSTICFYLLPYEKIDKLSSKLPLNYLFNKEIKRNLKNKTYKKENILELLERINSLKWEDMKNIQINCR